MNVKICRKLIKNKEERWRTQPLIDSWSGNSSIWPSQGRKSLCCQHAQQAHAKPNNVRDESKTSCVEVHQIITRDRIVACCFNRLCHHYLLWFRLGSLWGDSTLDDWLCDICWSFLGFMRRKKKKRNDHLMIFNRCGIQSTRNTTCEITWIKHLLEEMGVHDARIPIVSSDNSAAISIMKNHILHVKMKYVEIA